MNSPAFAPAFFPAALPVADTVAGEPVVLLHGLGLHRWAMARLARDLRAAGYRVVNLSYPSRTRPLEELAADWLPRQLQAAGLDTGTRVNFVTHSMGGILVRFYLRDHRAHPPGRVVMLAPPNQGSEVVNHLRDFPPFRWFTGVNGGRLGTDAASAPLALGPWPAGAGELGIIAGDRSFNPLFSAWIDGPNDGKVAVSRAQLEGMTDFIVLPHSHTWLVWCRDTSAQVLAFLREGKFARVTPPPETSAG